MEQRMRPGHEVHGETYRAAGMVPPWDVVWRDAVDVTHEHPSTWPWPWSMYAAGGRGPEIQDQVLQLHREAVERIGDVG